MCLRSMDSNRKEGETETVPVINPATQLAQLQALASELKTGFTEAMQELSRIQHGEYALEEKVQSCRCAMEEKVAEMKNSLNCFKDELSDAKSMIEEIGAKQEEMQQKIEQLQQEKRKESRKLKAKIQKEEHGSQTVPTPLQGSPFRSLNLPEPVLINEDFVKLLHNATYEKVSDCRPMALGEGSMKGLTSTNLEAEESLRAASSADAQPKGQSSSTVWKQPKDGKDWAGEHISKDQSDRQKELGPSSYSSMENALREPSIAAKRQNIALDLLESERKYVVNLTQVLKIKATLYGQDMKRNSKDRSFVPNSLRYLVQQHVDLLHALQERVLSWPRQGILGDIFLKLTNDENGFLDYYVACLRDLPECISLIHVVIVKEIEEEIKSDIYIFFFHIVQRVPEYLLHLQNILKYTEQEHPDYYLLLVSVQRLRVFISQHSLLFQCNEDLLIQKRKKLRKSSFGKLYKGLASLCASAGQDASPTLSATSIRDSGIHSEEAMQLFPSAQTSGTTAMHSRSHMKASPQQGREGLQGASPCEWETDGRRPEHGLAPSQLSEHDLKALAASLHATFPDLEYGGGSSAPSSAGPDGNCQRPRRRASAADLLQDSSGFAPDYEGFEYRGDPYEEVEPLRNLPAFEACSPASSESSIDICFLRPVHFTAEPGRTERTLQPLPKSAAPPASGTYKREVFRSKGKQLSRSLKEFPRSSSGGGSEGIASTRLYSTRSSSGSRLPAPTERGFPAHGAASAASRSSQRHHFPPPRGAGDQPSFLEEMHLEDNNRFSHRDDNEQTSFSTHTPRQEQKGRLRSSFRKLFKKK
ncbi:rho guanine nucleotide exchange factor 33 isoform X2 [Zootoca vivipara]|uniref:rho guanine nucleotide exchange factor 33 isoform X2 n=1 Tax=Zootoca vivipara TaxID=8524 RepID=UPI00293BB807|nr:rho guanine nucleotide exchange factor 33 isoform X2 [Zootoca vivipara]